jgi:phosphatidylglycerophosphate synthase
MPSRLRVRGIFKGIVMAMARPLARSRVRPDTITYFTLLLAVLAALCLGLLQSQILYGILVFFVGIFDGVDGEVARLNQTATKMGALSDSVVDKVAEAVVLISIAVAYATTDLFGMSVSIWVALCIFGWLMTSYVRARAECLGVVDLDVGLGGRSERLLTLVLFSVLLFLLWGLVVVTIMGVGTAAYRYYHYRQELLKKSLTV